MLLTVLAVACVLIAGSQHLAEAGQRRTRKPAAAAPAVSVKPKPHNVFYTVDEFIKARRAPLTAVSIEGYVVVAVRGSDGQTWSLTDSVDKVLSADDAQKLVAGSAQCKLPAKLCAKSGFAWSAKGAQRFVLYAGQPKAKTQLHDLVPKVRITGLTAKGRGVISPVTGVEFQDDSGDWRPVR